MRYILVPCFVKFDIEKEVAMTFDDVSEFQIIQLVTKIITDYSSLQVMAVIQEIKDNVRKLKRQLKDGDEVYMITSGSAWHNAMVSKILTEEGIPFKFLVYERRVRRYVVV